MEEILRTLVEFPTVSGDESADTALNYISDFLKQHGMFVKKYRSNGFSSLVATTQPAKKYVKVLLAAHLDVVPARSADFQLRSKDNRYHGRGVYDMKFAIAAYLQAVETLKPQLAELDFGIMITTDEEVSGNDGVRYLLDRGYGAEICLLPDGADGWHIEASAKGVYIVRVNAKGKTAHGSRPWEGDSAIDKLLAFLHAAQAQVPTPQQHTDTTLVVSMLHGGEAQNQIPAEASAMIDIRFLRDDTFYNLQRKLKTLAKAYGVQISTEMIARATEHDVGLPLVQAWEEVVQTVRGKMPAEYALSFGSSDARFLVDKGIPTIVTRPNGGGAHSAAEWIDIQGVNDFHTCVVRFLTESSSTSGSTTVDHKSKVAYNSK